MLVAAALGPLMAPLLARAQPAQRMRRIGTLSFGKRDNEVMQMGRAMLQESLRLSGWDEGRNLVVERRYAEGDVARLDRQAEELVRLDVELIVATSSTTTAAAKRATRAIPIVMIGVILPVELGFVESLSRPGGNVTGTAAADPETAAKAIQILREMAPGLTRLALLFNPTAPGAQRFLAERSRAASTLGMSVQTFPVTRPDEIALALDGIAAGRAAMLAVVIDGVIESRLREIADFALAHRILSIGSATLFTTVGGAIYYGSNLSEMVNRSVNYVDRILHGARPADLPVEKPRVFDLNLNLKTLHALGITVPRHMLLRANEVIE